MNKGPADLPKPTTPEERKTFVEMGSKQNSELKNPCLKEQKMSYKCLDENNYDHDKCAHVFANYKSCQQFWSKIKLERKRAGITPELPRPEDREQIRKEFMDKLRGKS